MTIASSAQPIIDIKTMDQARATVQRDRVIDRGFLPSRLTLVVIIATIAICFASWSWALVPIALLAADYLWFRARRARVLRMYENGRPRLSTPIEFAAVSAAYEIAGIPEPSMSDWNNVAGFGEVAQWREELRYRIAAAYYRAGTLIDIGCGDGRFCWRYNACSPEKYVGIDVSRGLLDTLSEKTQGKALCLESVAESLPMPNESADLIVCAECFEHLPNPEAALQEFNRILRHSGRIVIQSPNALRLRNFNPFHVFTLFIGFWYPKLLFRKVLHENTFVRAFTYHWDFTRQDFQAFVRSCPGLQIEEMLGATYRFNPGGSLPQRILAKLFRLPLVHWLGWDLTVVLVKT